MHPPLSPIVQHSPACIQIYKLSNAQPNIVHSLILLRGYKICFNSQSLMKNCVLSGKDAGVCQLVDLGGRRISDPEVILNLENMVNIHD
jgi:hypothetical protein